MNDNVLVNAFPWGAQDDRYQGRCIMTRGLREFLFQICGHCGDKGQCWRLWLQPFITLTRERAQLPLPMAARVPKRMPTADSFVGIPFMRPTLRMHWPSRLQRHTNTGMGSEDESVRGLPAAWNLLSGKLPERCFCAHLCRYVRVKGHTPLCMCQDICRYILPATDTQVCGPVLSL